MFWAIVKALKQLWRAFIRVTCSFIDTNAYFKVLMHFLNIQLGKILSSQQLIHYFFPDVVKFS